MSAQNAVEFTTRAPARKAGRYSLSESRTVECGDMERVGVGTDRKGEQALVYASGHAQSGIPMHAIATAIASGKVIPLDALASALRETGQLDKFVKAVGA